MPRNGTAKTRKSAFGTITMRRNGTFTVRVTDPDTNLRPSLGTFGTRLEAQRALNAAQGRTLDGKRAAVPRSPLTLADLAQEVAASRSDLAPGTQRNHANDLRGRLAKLASRRIDNIRPHDIETWWNANADAPVARRNAYFTMRGLFAFAVRRQYMAENPCRVRKAGADASQPRPTFTIEDFHAVADLLAPELRRAAHVAFAAHLRLGELSGLCWSDWNRERGTLTVARQRSAHGGALTPTKNRDTRTVYLLAPFSDALIEQAHERPGVAAEPIFRGERADRLPRTTLQRAWQSAAVEAGLSTLHFHDIRHISLTAVAPDASVRELMHRAGHRTERAAIRYQHATEQRDRDIATAASERLRRMIEMG